MLDQDPLAAAGAADEVSAVFRSTILQAAAPDDMRGRLQGIFFVVVPARHLTPGKPCTFAVESRGEGSQRWFGLNLYTDVPPAK